MFTERVRELLHRFDVSFSESIEGHRREAWSTFQIDTDAETGLNVRIHIVDDAFVVAVNHASLYRDRDAWGRDQSGWIADSLVVLERLVRNPLKIRLRRTWFRGMTGAIFVPDEGSGGAWNGDRAACRGKGHDVTFPFKWYRNPPK
jgi:hypothetical protein